MKRAEMVKLIAEYLNKDVGVDGNYYHADNILDLVEETMAPYRIRGLHETGDLRVVTDWESENECGAI